MELLHRLGILPEKAEKGPRGLEPELEAAIHAVGGVKITRLLQMGGECEDSLCET